MASGKRASMREGPLAQLFRKTEEDAAPEGKPREEREQAPEQQRRELRSQEPRGGRPLPEGGPGPQATKHIPEPQASQPEDPSFENRATEAARRAEERARRREEETPHEAGWSRYEGVPTPEERLRSVFSSDIPENILDRDPSPRPAPAVMNTMSEPLSIAFSSS